MQGQEKQTNPYLNVPAVQSADGVSISNLCARREAPRREAPKSTDFEIEIGFGKGHFLLDRAEKNPQITFIGLETRRKWVGLVQQRAEKRKLSNVYVWLGDARSVLSRLDEDAVFQRMFIHFPDPWWKARHEKRMVITESLARDAARVLSDHAEVFIQTDVDFRSDEYKRVFASHELFESETRDGVIDQNPFGSRSLREKKCEEVGLPIYRLLYRRRQR